jgi:lipopolysaccharide biosynthesis glycosyltransferase
MGLKKIDVAFAIDKTFIQHFCVALTSLLETNKDVIGEIYLINDIEEQGLLNTTFSFFKRKYRKEVKSIPLDKIYAKGFHIDGYITQATYYRMFLDKLLPPYVEKVLFLDSDVIVIGKIDFFTKLDFQKQPGGKKEKIKHTFHDEWYLYAVNNISDQNKTRLKALGLKGDKYFNAGVLIINLQKWRERKISNKLRRTARIKKDTLKFHDQDVLNIVLEKEWKEIDGKFNAINLEYSWELKKMEDYSIIHFTNFPKPWHYKNTHPFKKKYWFYLMKSPFKYYIPEDLSFKNFVEMEVVPRFNRIKDKVRNNRIPFLNTIK